MLVTFKTCGLCTAHTEYGKCTLLFNKLIHQQISWGAYLALAVATTFHSLLIHQRLLIHTTPGFMAQALFLLKHFPTTKIHSDDLNIATNPRTPIPQAYNRAHLEKHFHKRVRMQSKVAKRGATLTESIFEPSKTLLKVLTVYSIRVGQQEGNGCTYCEPPLMQQKLIMIASLVKRNKTIKTKMYYIQLHLPASERVHASSSHIRL